MRLSHRLLLPALLLAAACHHRSAGEDQTPEPELTPVRIEVTNNFALPVEIYASGQGSTRRLGMVYPGMRGSFNLPQGLIGYGSTELHALPTNGDRLFRSGPLLLSPGAFVEFRVAPRIFNSTVNVHPPL